MERRFNISPGVLVGIGFGCAFLAAFDNVPAAAGEKVLHAFQGGSDGAYPNSPLIADAGGNFYGVTGGGGTGCQKGNCGTAFKLGADNSETVLYAFKGGSDGDNPDTGLVEDGANNFYGTTLSGGTANLGTVFELAANGTETVLHAFQGGTDGAGPNGLIEDGTGNFYGTTGGAVAVAWELFSKSRQVEAKKCSMPFRAAAMGANLTPV